MEKRRAHYRQNCLQCGGSMSLNTRTMVAQMGDMTDDVSDVNGWFCDNCGEVEFADAASAQRYAQAMDTLMEVQRAACAAEIKYLRKRIKLSQRQAGVIFGGGVNAFSRYERGETEPPKSTVTLLRLLNKHPELLDEIRNSAA